MLINYNRFKLFSLMTFMFFAANVYASVETGNDDSLQSAKEKVTRGFQAPSYDTNFSSVLLFSIADIGRTTKKIKQSSSWKMTRSADYQIETEATGSPIIKVQASTVIIDLNGYRLNKLDTNQYGVNLDYGVGIEVGYSPYELSLDTTLEQPQNVIIRNGVISNFEIGIVVHEGVKSVKIENVTISRSPVGIAFLGNSDKKISSCSLDNVRVVGDNTDNQIRLGWAKAKIEQQTGSPLVGTNTGFNYGTDYFMPAEYNPVTDALDALVYSGLYMKYCSNMLVSNVGINTIGYDGQAHLVLAVDDAGRSEPDKSESNVEINGAIDTGVITNSVAHGLIIKNCSTIFVNEVESSNHISALTTLGLVVKDSSSCSITKSVFSNNEVTTIQDPLESYDFTTDLNTEITDVTTKRNDLDSSRFEVGVAITITGEGANIVGYADAALAPTTDPIATAVTVGTQIGLAQTARATAEAAVVADPGVDRDVIDDIDELIVSLQTYKTALEAYSSIGLSSKGMYFNNADAMQLKEITCNRNQADNLVKGVHIDTGNVIEMTDVMCDHNEADGASLGSVTGIHIKDVNTSILKMITTNYNKGINSVKGVFLETAVAVEMVDVSCSNNVSTITSNDGIMYGIHATSSDALDFTDVSCNYNKAEGAVKGIFLDTVSAVELKDVFVNNNQSSVAEVVGLDVNAGNSMLIREASASYNLGKTTSHGMQFTSPNAVEMYSVTADNNRLVDSAGTIARGIYLSTPQSFLMEDISCSNNIGETIGEGMRVENGATISLKNAIMSLNTSVSLGASEATTKVTNVDVSKHANYSFPSGAAGLFAKDTKDLSCYDVFSSKNKGPRAVGIFASGCDNSSWFRCTTSFQEATGDYFITDPFVADGDDDLEALPVEDNHAATLFGGVGATGTVNLKVATEVFLTAVKNIKEDQWLYELTPNYVNNKDFSSSLLLLRAAVAKFRLFSTAIGLHLHGCTNCIVEDHFSSGNISEQDSAIGFACTGTNNGHVIRRGKFAGNEAWTKSALGAVVADKYSLAALKPFWDKISEQPTVDFSNDADYTSERTDTKVIGLRTVTFHEVEIDPGYGGGAADYELVNPIGGMGVGILIGDAAQNIEVRSTDCSNNKGHCGQSYGILQDVTSSTLIQDNRLYQCDVNLLGICYGLAEMTSQSDSIHVGNILFSNKIQDYLNSNYLVPFNPDDPFDLSFPLKTAYNGDVGNLANASPYDNIEIRFVHAAPNNLYVPNDIAISTGTPEWEVDRGGTKKMFDA